MSLHTPLPGASPALGAPLMILLLVLAAAGYALASYGLKVFAMAGGPGGAALIGAGIALAVVTEIVLLRRMDLSTGYVVIVAIETALVLLAAMSLGETIDARKVAGAVLVLGGLLLVH